MGASMSEEKIWNVTELRASKPEAPSVFRRMSPQQRLLHETIIRALQMVLNAWKHYLDNEKKQDEKQDPQE